MTFQQCFISVGQVVDLECIFFEWEGGFQKTTHHIVWHLDFFPSLLLLLFFPI